MFLSFSYAQFFRPQVRSLRMKILPSMVQEGLGRPSGRAQMYVTLAAAAFQPLILYWLTIKLVH